MPIKQIFSFLMSSGGEADALGRALAPLDHVLTKGGQRAYRFVMKGEDEAILLELGRLNGAAAPWIGNPGSGTHFLWSIHGEASKYAEASLRVRDEYYRGLVPERWPELRRLGLLFSSADQGKALRKSGGPRIPDWLQYAVSDLLAALRATRQVEATLTQTHGWLSLGLLHAGLEAERQDGTLALDLIFGRHQAAYGSELGLLSTISDLDEYLLAHPDAVRALPDHLDAEGRVALVRHLGAGRLATPFAHVLVRLATDPSKQTRTEASKHLGRIEVARRIELLADVLESGRGNEREHAADLLGRIGGEEAVGCLEAALGKSPNKPLRQAIQTALSNQVSTQQAGEHGDLEPPPFSPLPVTELSPTALADLKENYRELLEEQRSEAEKEEAANQKRAESYKWRSAAYKSLQGLKEKDLQSIIAKVNGIDLEPFSGDQLAVLQYKGRVLVRPDFGIDQFLRVLRHPHQLRHFWGNRGFQQWRKRHVPEGLDLRQLEDAFQRVGMPVEAIAWECLRGTWGWSSTPQSEIPPEKVWPFFLQHINYLEQALGLAPTKEDYLSPTLALEVIGTFPALPPTLIHPLLSLALGEGKTHRAAAQEALKTLPGLRERIAEALGSGKGEVRTVAAEWLAALGETASLPALRNALRKESRETTRASLLAALEKLGEDLTPYLSPDSLLAEAEKGLKAKAPKGLDWFPFASLPPARWHDGTPVSPSILQWWITLACKLKEPGENPLLHRYLHLLDQPSREALGSFILKAFITQDTLRPSLEDAQAHARTEAPQRLAMYRQWAQSAWGKEYAGITEAIVLDQLKKERLSVYLGSVIGEKGILSLIACAPAAEAVALVRGFMRDHYMRRSQIEAMIEGLSASDHPLVIQLLLSVARRHRTASIQARARELVVQVAQRRGWTEEELADRTIPTAGFDDRGIQALDFGPRSFTLRLGAEFKSELINAEGKALKALPDPNQGDDKEKAKEAKAQFALSKKELKQVLDLQGSRLYEAMCAQRAWPLSEWKEFLHGHPIMGRLIQQLVWLDGDGRSFRPAEDGSFLDLRDDEVSLHGDAVRLAHACLLPGEDAKGWVQHLKSYKIKSLFPQMDRPMPPPLVEGQVEMKDREGWVSDTFTLRGTFTKLGYQRGGSEDGGFFSVYTKDFTSVGIQAVVEFTGNTLPEENVGAALKGFCFFSLANRNRWQTGPMPLKDVPPVLLAEVYGDYLTLAKACRGFDPAWATLAPF